MEHKKIGAELGDSYDDQQKWVLDSSLDSRGRVPLRARTGAWRASLFIIALVEKQRLDHTNNNKPMSAIWLAPQFIVIGIADAFTLVGLQEYFYDQVPDSMRSLGIAFYLSVIGTATFLNNLLLTAVDTLAEDFSGKSWFGKDLNSSRLDRFYWFLAGVTAANICVFVIVAKRCPYKSVQPNQTVAELSVSVA